MIEAPDTGRGLPYRQQGYGKDVQVSLAFLKSLIFCLILPLSGEMSASFDFSSICICLVIRDLNSAIGGLSL